ncbi:MAG: DUF5993 family protein [Phycisphaerales bacterium]|nr:DUF5993 family protein [Phycisphaerales bacterium]
MVAAAIFLLLLLTLASSLTRRRRLTSGLAVACFACMLLLGWHHMSDTLGLHF